MKSREEKMLKKQIASKSKIEVLNGTVKQGSKKKGAAKKAAKPSKAVKAARPAVEVKTRKGAKLPRTAKEVANVTTGGNSTSAQVAPTNVQPTPTPQKYKFEVGTKFMLGTTIFHVKKSYADSNTEFRKLWSLENGEEVVELASLMRDKGEMDFRIVQ
jgi:hypothetical protein